MRASVGIALGAVAISAHFALGAATPPATKTQAATSGSGPPKLVTTEGRTRLAVAGKPFVVLGGELANSSASSLPWAKRALAKLPALGLNTVLVPVSWELIEPVEAKFDFRLVGDIIREARRDRLHVGLLWFGSWKNGMSSYVPGWVKRDQKRFPRAETADGRGVESLSAFSNSNRDADARAFAALLRYVRAIDERAQTVILVQVENEVAMIGETTDRNAAASAAYRAPVPAELLRAAPPGTARATGSWEDVFGKGAASEERFAAWSYARYVDAVARAGKAAYPLPMFVNAALNRPGLPPGKYPSGGPLPHLFEIWKAGAPTIDFMSPDIYFPGFAGWCERYRRPDNPLFVPETKNGEEAAVNAFYAVGQQALGVSPFAIDEIAPAAGVALTSAYHLLAELAPVLSAAGAGRTAGVLVDKENPTTKLTLGGFALTVSHDYTFPWSSAARNDAVWPEAGGLIVALGADEYLVAGNGLIVTFAPSVPSAAGGPLAGIERIDEGRYETGRFVVTRRLNGDETHQGRQLRLPMGTFGVRRVKLYRYR